MRVPLGWLSEYVELPRGVRGDPEQLASAFDGLGHEVESVTTLEAPFSGVVVGRVRKRRAHPDADRLQLVEVDAGGRTVEVVCGAWNFEEGDLVPLATPGAVLAGGLEVGEREIRGVLSVGMICSEAELGLGEDAGGILVLSNGHQVGSDLAHELAFPDVVFDLSIKTNRADCMSMLGLAKELAALYQVEVLEPSTLLEPTAGEVDVKVIIEDPVGCPRYVARPVVDFAIGPSPPWMQLRLRTAGLRPVNGVVDVTNYVLLEMGQPIHAFDLERLAGETIVVRRAAPGESLLTLDGVTRDLHPEDLVIADAQRPVALAGVMGGEDSEVGDETLRVLIESAYFDPSTVLLTAKRHGLRTEASARFERGLDPNRAGAAADRVAGLLAEVAGGRVSSTVRDLYPEVVKPWEVELPLSEIERLLGLEVPVDTTRRLLERLHFGVRGEDPLVVTVPTSRPDVTRKADLVEEVARLLGYDEIPETLPTGSGGGLPPSLRAARRLRSVMVGAGYHQAETLSFLGHRDLDRLGLPADDPRRVAIEVANPLREQESLLRPTLLPGLLGALSYNRARRVGRGALFEIGRVFRPGGRDLPDQPEMLGFVSDLEGTDVYDATALWRLLAEAMRIEDWDIQVTRQAPFHPGRTGLVTMAGSEVGVLGEVHPSVARGFDLEGRIAAGELELEPLIAERPWWRFHEPSSFPPVVFDMAFDVDEEVGARRLLDEVRGAAGETLESLEIFDLFRGDPLPPGRKSVALRFVMRAADHTLTDEETGVIRAEIERAVGEQLGGRLRSG